MKKIIKLLSFLFVTFYILTNALLAADIRLSVLKYGTVNWELNVIKEHGLDSKYGINLDITYLTNKNANAIALMSKSADIIVTDWVWVSRQRDKGKDFTLIPYSTAAGAIMVSNDSPITSIDNMKGAQIGIAGGSIDKSWILIRAYTIKLLGYDIAKHIEPAYAAPPLINGMVIRGKFDGALNYWNYTARLKALNFRKIISIEEILPKLGIGKSLPLIGYVFSEKWANNNQDTLKSFIAASEEAREVLRSSDIEWERIKALTGAKDASTLEALKEGFRNGIPSSNATEYKSAIKNAFKILAEIGGRDLVGNSKELSDGVIWEQ